ncbi:MAG TPA: hypothetical protein VGQ36_05980 [Thermoanaerobaculia bacterium]|nr:hypothetical protein [Thermoanaerobaculia bacterium]
MSTEELEIAIHAVLITQRFKLSTSEQHVALGCSRFWARRTLNTNRATAFVRDPASGLEARAPIGESCQRLKWQLLRTTFTIPFLYPVGLQIILAGDGLLSDAEIGPDVVDLIDNQRVVLQGVFVVDTRDRRFRYWSSPGLYLTSKLHTAIAEAIASTGFDGITQTAAVPSLRL